MSSDRPISADGAADGAAAPEPFAVLPAIDLLGGRVVRLRQGDFEQETTYDDDPVGVASALVEAGARWLHVVDLDGARSGEPRQADVIAAIVNSMGEAARCEVAGGLRTEAAVDAAMGAGAARVVIGTAALRDPSFAARLIDRHGPASVVAAIDVRDGLAVGGAWLPGAAGVPADIAIERLADVGVSTFEATAIASDGRMGGPDLELLRRLLALGRGRVIASGGVRSIEDIEALAELGCAGVIVGTALYEGRLDLAAALRAATRATAGGQ